MGCDIHFECERRMDGAWLWVPHPERDCWSCVLDAKDAVRETGKPALVVKPDCDWCHGTGRRREQFYHQRNYGVFAILADVRNPRETDVGDGGEGFIPISEPRGLPDDLSPELRAYATRGEEDDPTGEDDDYAQRVDLGEHSQSWLLLSEVLDFDWDRVTIDRGWVDPWNFELWRTKGRPSSWSGGVYGARIEHVSNSFMARAIDQGNIQWTGEPPEEHTWRERPYSTHYGRSPLIQMLSGSCKPGTAGAAAAQDVRYVTQVEWPLKYREFAETFLKCVNEELVPLGEPKDTRLVFGFDS